MSNEQQIVCVILPAELHNYLLYIAKKYINAGLDVDELPFASALWKTVNEAKPLPTPTETGSEVVHIPGPISVVHEGDVEVK